MKAILTTTALAAALALGTFGVNSAARAQDSQPTTKPCIGDLCPGGATGGGEQGNMKKRMKPAEQGGQMQQNNQDQSGDQVMPRKKRVQNDQQNDQNTGDMRSRTRVGEGKWRYDPSREQRRRNKDATFRFYFGGYWYPQPYWDVYGARPAYRISCGEGRAIVAERFNRVRVVECSGGTYTYIGRRSGDTYRVMVNARTGRIVGRALI